MNILDNNLVQRYFGCEKKPPCSEEWCVGCTAMAILRAMQQPIEDGEKYLTLSPDGEITEYVNTYADIRTLHASSLRLPNRFQENEMENKCDCNTARCRHGNMFLINHPKPSPEKDEVEEKIREILEGMDSPKPVEDNLRELVRLARK